uniref:Uncharacterized protein n=1 Tax=Arundo donax TaxID=35708 RepID=A0A0A9EA29_ARUDO
MTSKICFLELVLVIRCRFTIFVFVDNLQKAASNLLAHK